MCRPDAYFSEFTGLRAFDANFFLIFLERSNFVTIEAERISLRFSRSWPLLMDFSVSHHTIDNEGKVI